MTRRHTLLAAIVSALVASAAVSAQPPDGPRDVPKRPPPRQRAAPAPESPKETPSDVRVRSFLSQTAAWVGDPVDFVVEVDAGPGIDLVAGDLAPERVVVEGFELGSTSAETEERADGWRTFRHRYRLTPWDTTPPKRVAPLTIRFRRPVTSANPSGTTGASEIVVPGATLSMRSTLPDDGNVAGAIDRAAGAAAPAWLEWLRPAGLGLIALGVAPVVLWLAARNWRPRRGPARVSSRTLHSHLSGMFREIDIIDTSSADGRRRAYDRLDADLRTYVTQAAGLPAAALTVDELRARLPQNGRVSAGVICDALADCEQARYGSERAQPSSERLRTTLDDLKTALGIARA